MTAKEMEQKDENEKQIDSAENETNSQEQDSKKAEKTSSDKKKAQNNQNEPLEAKNISSSSEKNLENQNSKDISEKKSSTEKKDTDEDKNKEEKTEGKKERKMGKKRRMRKKIKRVKKGELEVEDLSQEEKEYWMKAKGDSKLKRMRFKAKSSKKSLKERIFGKTALEKGKRKKARIEFELYVIVFFFYHVFGNILPLGLAFAYSYYVLFPMFENITSPVFTNNPGQFSEIVHMGEIFQNFTVAMQDPVNLTIFLTAPLVLLGIYLFRQFTCASVGKFIYWLFNWIRPRKELDRASFMGEQADDVNIYHTRNFLLRILKWQFQKSPFPWLTPWMYNYVGSNDLGENTVVEEGLFTLEFLKTGKNVYMAPMAGTSTHFVEGTYQSLTVKQVEIGDNCVVGARDCVSPGIVMEDESQLLQFTGITKLIHVPAGTDNFGMPASRLTYSKYQKLMDFPEDIAKEDRKIYKKRRRRLRRKRRKEKRKREQDKDE